MLTVKSYRLGARILSVNSFLLLVTTMDSLRHFPLGTSFLDSPHAVVASLPTMADVIGYEEHEPRVVKAMASGYPRFVVHAYVARLIYYYLKQEALVGRAAVLIPSQRAACDLVEHFEEAVEILEVEPALYMVHLDGSDENLADRLRKFVQHVGCGISSRQAEDLLIQYRQLERRFKEISFEGHARTEIESRLAEQIDCCEKDVLVCASGMNAFYAGYRAVREFQRSRGRKCWLQLGWLYLDSGVILQKFLGHDETLEVCYDVSDTDAILEKICAYGERLAAVVVEFPSNPSNRICELQWISEAVRKQGGVMIVDPTIASVYNVDALPCADLLVTSLTKYAAIEGDVMIGALALNSESPFYNDLVLSVSSFHVAPYRRDLERLAYEMQSASDVIAQMNANADRLCQFLKRHSAVERVYCASCTGHNMKGVAKGDGPVGAVISIELKGSMEKFYDTMRCMKGPSFGTRYTLLCPFLYLAHYDLVTTGEGRAFLSKVGLDPELIRISVGSEPYESIEAVFVEALDALLVN